MSVVIVCSSLVPLCSVPTECHKAQAHPFVTTLYHTFDRLSRAEPGQFALVVDVKRWLVVESYQKPVYVGTVSLHPVAMLVDARFHAREVESAAL